MKLMIAYYGDDLTGSTDVMEALSLVGVPTVLFIDPPTEKQRAVFADVRAIGLAGTSRSETPEWMRVHLRAAFQWLHSLDAEITHYKVCSTFDSSPEVGNIGTALDIGREIFGHAPVPIVVGAPQLRRYTAFGHLFAAFQDRTYRIDRHPVMARHPVTPMADSDLIAHLSKQTAARIVLVDFPTSHSDAAVDRIAADAEALLFDVLDTASQTAVGRQLVRLQHNGSRFVIGSSGVEYALAHAWNVHNCDLHALSFEAPGAVEKIAVVSGSVSPTTARQIEHAVSQGFVRLSLDPRAFLDHGARDTLIDVTQAALDALDKGQSVIVHTALGPDTDLGAELAASAMDGRHAIGRGLGQLLAQLVRQAGLRRAIIAGGDTSSHALKEMGIYALTLCLPIPQTPGSPLCTAHSDDPDLDGLQIALKGGQVGNDAYFSNILHGLA
ncbi:Hrp-dependent type III effector protein [Gluconobacter oxydans]|nr:four-carbon acid sugar kinase family protein [Gluconobacter oxydans]KXV10235.1 Hrp-dependent type III effector protein [Gluconobacter oxydans]